MENNNTQKSTNLLTNLNDFYNDKFSEDFKTDFIISNKMSPITNKDSLSIPYNFDKCLYEINDPNLQYHIQDQPSHQKLGDCITKINGIEYINPLAIKIDYFKKNGLFSLIFCFIFLASYIIYRVSSPIKGKLAPRLFWLCFFPLWLIILVVGNTLIRKRSIKVGNKIWKKRAARIYHITSQYNRNYFSSNGLCLKIGAYSSYFEFRGRKHHEDIKYYKGVNKSKTFDNVSFLQDQNITASMIRQNDSQFFSETDNSKQNVDLWKKKSMESKGTVTSNNDNGSEVIKTNLDKIDENSLTHEADEETAGDKYQLSRTDEKNTKHDKENDPDTKISKAVNISLAKCDSEKKPTDEESIFLFP